MVSEQDIDDIVGRWRDTCGDGLALAALSDLAREAIRERDSEQARAESWIAKCDAAQRELQRAGDRHAAAIAELAELRSKLERSRRLVEALRAGLADIAEYERVATEMPGEPAASALAAVREDIEHLLAEHEGGPEPRADGSVGRDPGRTRPALLPSRRVPHAHATDSIAARIDGMTAGERRKTLIDAGILDSDGYLAEHYRGPWQRKPVTHQWAYARANEGPPALSAMWAAAAAGWMVGRPWLPAAHIVQGWVIPVSRPIEPTEHGASERGEP